MKKNFNKHFILLTVILAFVSCQDTSDPSISAFSKPGNGLFSLTLGSADTTRTILPPTPKSSDFAWFELKFSNGNSNITEWRTGVNLSNSVELPVGTYDLVVTAYVDSGRTMSAANGSVSGIVILDGQITTKAIILEANTGIGEPGTFRWEIETPEVTFASMKISSLDANAMPLIIGGSVPFEKNGFLTLNSGEYRVEFYLRDTKGQIAELKEILHVYPYMESTFQHVFLSTNFHALLVKKIDFSEGEEVDVDFYGLDNKSFFLIKINVSNRYVPAARTGNAGISSPDLQLADSSSSYDMEEPPQMGHPGTEEFLANLPSINRRVRSQAVQAQSVGYKVGDKRYFWLDQDLDNHIWLQREATLLTQGIYSNIWVINNSIDSNKAQEIAAKFDVIYRAETNILGHEFGGGPDGNGGKDGDPRIQILFYPIGNEVAGYFAPKDYYEQSDLDSGGYSIKTNRMEIFYMDSDMPLETTYSTLVHEFQHMIHFNRKVIRFIENNEEPLPSYTWYQEMLSAMAEDIMAYTIGIPLTDGGYIVHQRMIPFLQTYFMFGIDEWYDQYESNNLSRLAHYSKVFAFGAYLMRNFGGVELLSKIMSNDAVGIESITMALDEIYPGLTFEHALSRFGETLGFNRFYQDSVLTFDKAINDTINGITYIAPGIDVLSIAWNNIGIYMPTIYRISQDDMRPHSISRVYSDDDWLNITGDFRLTFEKPSDPDVLLFLMMQ